MNLTIVKSYFIVAFTVLFMSGSLCNEINSIDFFHSDSLTDDVSRAKYLLDLSKTLKKYDNVLSLNSITQAYNLASLTDNDSLIAACNLEYGIILSKNKQAVSSLFHLKNALTYYESINDTVALPPILVNIGLTYINDNKPKKSQVFLTSALAEYGILKDTAGIILCHTLLGRSFENIGSVNDATEHYSKALNLSSAIHNSEYQATNLLNICKLNMKSGTNDSILLQINRADRIIRENSIHHLIPDYLITYSNYYLSLNDTLKSIEYLHKYINLIENDDNNKVNELMLLLEEFKSDGTGNYSYTLVFLLLPVALLIALVIFLVIRIKKQKSSHLINMERCRKEIIAFRDNITGLEEKIKTKTNSRLIEIEDEIKSNNLNKISIQKSYEGLKRVNYLKDMFLSKISHEIRTPLSGILGFAEILETQLALMDENDLFEFASSITESGLSLVSLLNNILDISRLNSNNMKLELTDFNTADLIHEAVNNYQAEAGLKGLKLIIDAKQVPDIHTDRELLSKVLSLILSNSVKFTEKGYIKVSLFLSNKKNSLIITIVDTGIGIDKVYIDEVFEPFRQESLGYSTSYQGAGLGLPLAKKMVNKLTGTIEISSVKGTGTTITISLPLKFSASKPEIEIKENKPPAQTDSAALPWETASVLVVEDDAMNQILYRKILKKSKNLEIAKDGKTALSVIEKHLGKNKFDFVLMDINLPAPWDGISLMKEIRKQWPEYQEVPFIAQTAYAISGNRNVMLGEGFDEYITKPIIKRTLINTIKSALN